jgi:DNA-binding transcriptional ArsR family regulator
MDRTDAAADEADLDGLFRALADPTRRAIVRRLSTGEATVNELAAPFDLTQQAISRHVKVLEHAGLVARSRSGQTRPCRLQPDRLAFAVGWIEEQRQVWADRHERLAGHLHEIGGGR